MKWSSFVLPLLSLLTPALAAAEEAVPTYLLVRTADGASAVVLSSLDGPIPVIARGPALAWVGLVSKAVDLSESDPESPAARAALLATCEAKRPPALKAGATVQVLSAQGPVARTLGPCRVDVIGGNTVEVRLVLEGPALPDPVTLAAVDGPAPSGARLLQAPAVTPAPAALQRRLEAALKRGGDPKAPALRERVRLYPAAAQGHHAWAEVCLGELGSGAKDQLWCQGSVLAAVGADGKVAGFVNLPFEDEDAQPARVDRAPEPADLVLAPIARFDLGGVEAVVVQRDGIGNQLVDLLRVEGPAFVRARLYGYVVE